MFDSSPVLLLWATAPNAPCCARQFSWTYGLAGARKNGSLAHPPMVCPSRMIQRQGPLQGLVALQLPLHVPILALVCNCRAETVPAHKTAAVIAARNVFWMIFLPMIVLLSLHLISIRNRMSFLLMFVLLSAT